MQIGNDAILEAAKVWNPEARYIGKVSVSNICATYKMDGGIHGQKTGDIHLHIETNSGVIEVYEFGFNGQGEFPFASYSTQYQNVSFDDGVTDTLTIKGKDSHGKAYTVTLRKIA